MNLSEAEDDPESYESSEDEWVETEKKTSRRRTTRKIAKKPKKSLEVDESSDSTSDRSLPKPKNGAIRKKKSPSSKVSPSTASSKKKGYKIVYSNNYAVGSFVISKQDAQVGDPNKHPWIWRIDGKSLLQKYEPFEHEGKVRHKNTSIYTGWSPMDMDDYAPLTIDLIEQTEGQVVVELHWDELKKIIHNDSE
ncbi:uncharacterized protein LOC123672545 isoform X2 [Harmonia axyridis]|uniref:uncharacterized protein LOC123672545 isoform X2 n=1 Tax=Harmonia axyridis TaxID=115357 RepID=UPI001E278291|nr:uncharacterized protein LOC123672545 isoform X2 [Harmonia axyridis]